MPMPMLLHEKCVKSARLNQKGFSLIELLVSFSLVAILTSLALPSFSALQNNTSIRSTRQALIQDIRLLRTHATNLRRSAYLCALDEAGECSRRSDWGLGWMGFIDNNDNRRFDAADKTLFSYQSNGTSNINVQLHTRWKNIKIDARGRLRSSGHFRICDPKITGEQNMKVIRMNVHGRLAIEQDTLHCA